MAHSSGIPTRVGRRLLLAFVGVAAVPVIAIGMYTFGHFSQVLRSQHESFLEATVRTQGHLILENLYQARELIQAGSIIPSVFSESDPIAELVPGELTLTVDTAAAEPRIGLRSEKGGVAWLAAEYLWASTVTLPYEIQICVFSDQGARLFCSDTDPNLINRIQLLSQRLSFTSVTEQLGESRFQVAGWQLFLAANFRSDAWNLVGYQNETDTIGPFQLGRVIAALVGLALATALLFSLIHLRRRLGPLKALTDATANLARQNFEINLDLKTGDEFESLGQSITDMAQRLKRQFIRMETEAEIDQLILTSKSVDPVIERFLAAVEVFTPCDSFCVGVIDFDNPRAAAMWTSRANDATLLPMVRHNLTDDELRYLTAAEKPTALDLTCCDFGFLSPLRKLGCQHGVVMSIGQSGAMLGFLISGHAEPPELDAKLTHALTDVRDRLAVALSAAEKDESLFAQAHYDTLTGLPNRFLLLDRLHQEFSRAQRSLSLLGVLFIDLDRFKNVNDSLGHSQGDLLLKEVARRLQKLFRETDTVSRLGGDEYVILLPDAESEDHIGEMADRVLAALDAPVALDGSSVYVNASIGISVFPGDGKSPEELLTSADTAMYRAKESGRSQKCFFTEELNVAVRKRLDIESKLRQALANEEFAMVYQPQLCLAEGTLCGVEALIRWPESAYRPVDFIPVAEDSGLITEIGQWALNTACAEFSTLPPSIRPKRFSINVSSRQLKTLDYADNVLETLRRHRISPDHLEIEITESVLLDDFQDARRAINELGKAGVALALDDFGTGYSSLRYLQQLPIQTIKIDQGFIKGIGVINEDEVLVKSVINLSRVLGKQAVAEGVEKSDQLEFLRLNQCHAAQGFLISKPLKIFDYQAFLVQWSDQTVNEPARRDTPPQEQSSDRQADQDLHTSLIRDPTD